LVLLAAGILGYVLLWPTRAADVRARQPLQATLIRIGFSTQTPLHTALGAILRHTAILSQNGLTGEFVGFKRGKDQHQACAGGRVDVTFTCEVPAMIHLHRLPGLVITGSPGELGDIALVVRAASSFKELKDLSGKRISVMGGSSSRLVTEQWVKQGRPWASGPPTLKMNRGKLTQALQPLLAGEAEAAVLWDPWLTSFQERHSLRVLKKVPFWSLVAVYEDRFSEAALAAYHRALKQALTWAAAHPRETTRLVAENGPISAIVARRVLAKNGYVRGTLPASLILGEPLRRRLKQCEAHARRAEDVPRSFSLQPRLRQP